MGKRIGSITPYKMERWDLFAEGYYLNLASSFNIDAEAEDDKFSVYGHDGNVNVKIVRGGRLSVQAISDKASDNLNCVLTGQNPDAAAVKAFNPTDSIKVDIWRNLRSADNSKYIRALWIPKWSGTASPGNGDPAGRGNVASDAPTEIPLEFAPATPNGSVAITAELVMLDKQEDGTFTGNMTNTPLRVPLCNHPLSQMYALGLDLIEVMGNNRKLAKIAVTANNVTADGSISIAAFDLIDTEITAPIAVYVKFLTNETSIYPVLDMEGLHKALYSITAFVGVNGAITPSGKIYVKSGMDKAFVISADEGYEISSVLVDGVSVGSVGTYVFENISSDHTISAAMTQVDVNTVSLLHFDIDENSIQQLGTATVDVADWYDERWTTLLFPTGTAVPDPIPLNTSGLRIRFTSGALSGQTFDIISVYQGFVDPEYPEYSEPDTVTVSGDASAAVNGDTFVVEQIVVWDSKREVGYTFTGSLQDSPAKWGEALQNGGSVSLPLGALGMSNFTVEAWAYFTDSSGIDLWNQFEWLGSPGGDYNQCKINMNAGQFNTTVSFYALTGNGGTGSRSYLCNLALVIATPISRNEWHHIAVVRNGAIARAFIDGVGADIPVTGYPDHVVPLQADTNITFDMDTVLSTHASFSMMDEWRYSNIARYSEDFTPPTEPFGG